MVVISLMKMNISNHLWFYTLESIAIASNSAAFEGSFFFSGFCIISGVTFFSCFPCLIAPKSPSLSSMGFSAWTGAFLSTVDPMAIWLIRSPPPVPLLLEIFTGTGAGRPTAGGGGGGGGSKAAGGGGGGGIPELDVKAVTLSWVTLASSSAFCGKGSCAGWSSFSATTVLKTFLLSCYIEIILYQIVIILINHLHRFLLIHHISYPRQSISRSRVNITMCLTHICVCRLFRRRR